MATENEHEVRVDPEADIQKSVPGISDGEFVAELVDEVNSALSQRAAWDRKVQVYYQRRYGMRGKKNTPWPGASNISLPLIDKAIRKIKPVYVSAVFNVSPITKIEPFTASSHDFAKNVEHGYDWLVRYRMRNTREALIHAVDAMPTYGFALMKCFWNYETERVRRVIRLDFAPPDFDPQNLPEGFEAELARQLGLDPTKEPDATTLEDALAQVRSGSKRVEVVVRVERENAPRWSFVDPRDVIVPWDSDTDIDRLPWICHRMFLTKRELQQRRDSGRYDSQAVSDLISGDPKRSAYNRSGGTYLDVVKGAREGVSEAQSSASTYEVYEIYTWYDINGDGVPERVVVTVAPGKEGARHNVLRAIEYPYEHKQWPFVRFPYEVTDPRWYSPRGVPELLYDLNEELNAQHNAKIDNMKLTNSTTFKVVQGGVQNPQNLRFQPGAAVVVRRPDDIDTFKHQVLDYSFDNEERILKAWAEEYIGNLDSSLGNVNQDVERRTATEVNEISRTAGMVQDLDLKVFQESMRRLHFQTMRLWAQFGDMSVLVRIDGEEDPVLFSRFDLDQDFEIVPTGRADNLDGRTRYNQTVGLLNVLATNPETVPYVNIPELVKSALQNLDLRLSNRVFQAPGVATLNEQQEQIREISGMMAVGEVAPVNMSDNHELHLGVLQRAMLAHQDDPGLAWLLVHHQALHAFALGERQLLEALIEGGAQFQQVGSKLVITQPAQPPEGEQGENERGDAGGAPTEPGPTA